MKMFLSTFLNLEGREPVKGRERGRNKSKNLPSGGVGREEIVWNLQIFLELKPALRGKLRAQLMEAEPAGAPGPHVHHRQAPLWAPKGLISRITRLPSRPH